MAYEQRNLTGSLFKNDKKTADNHPNAQGSCLIDGVEYYISAWTKKDNNGNPWQSLAFKRKDAKKPEPEKKTEYNGKGGFEDMDDDSPF